ncbi:MAG TPA: hypothetical protein VHJ99_14430 [Candidatus Dormibacteraeota bacterium]|nr:hypothetical protein [Candidatus Dormibacteraeota bacterium]
MPEFDLEGTFNEDYLHFYLGGLTEERNEAEAAEIVDTLELHPVCGSWMRRAVTAASRICWPREA